MHELWKIDFVVGPKKKLVHGEQGRRWRGNSRDEICSNGRCGDRPTRPEGSIKRLESRKSITSRPRGQGDGRRIQKK
jgi:hypothetical protein